MGVLMNNEGGAKKKIVIAIVVIIVLLIGVKACASLRGNVAKQMEQMEDEKVTTVEVTRRDLTNAVSVTGTIESVDARTITSDVRDVLVKEVLVSVGEHVEAGQVIARLDSADLEKKLSTMENNYNVNQKLNELKSPKEIYDETVEKAKIAFARVEANCNAARNEYLKYENDKTSAEFKAAEKAWIAAEAEALMAMDTYERALKDAQKTYEKNVLEQKLVSTESETDKIKNYKEQIEKCEIKAPMSGTISKIDIKVGEKLATGNVAEILDNEHFKVVANVDEYDINKIYLNQKVKVKTNANGNDLIDGTVTYVAVTASEDLMKATGSARYKIEITLNGAQDKIRVGMKGTANIELNRANGVLSVPYDCVETQNGKSVVTIVDGEQQKTVEVTCGLMTNYYVEISGPDIKEGTKVLLKDTLVTPKEDGQTDDANKNVQ